jgi:hypothetical protein
LVSFLAVSLLILACSSIPEPTQTPPPVADDGTFENQCGWPTGTALAFSGWASLADLGIADQFGTTNSTQLVHAIVTRDRITMMAMVGAATMTRGICWTDGEFVGVTGVADDWVLVRPH